jgi:hypothetical protein
MRRFHFMLFAVIIFTGCAKALPEVKSQSCWIIETPIHSTAKEPGRFGGW